MKLTPSIPTIKVNSVITRGVPAPHPELVKALADSIKGLNFRLLNPITVDKKHRLIAGSHRLAAFKRLGIPVIPAHVIDIEGAESELARIDENLIRKIGTALERSEMLAKRKVAYELIHPEVKEAAKGGRPRKGKPETVSSFAKDTAAATGVTDRSVRQYTQVAEDLDDEARAAIRETPVADSITDLLKLSQMEPTEQRAVAKQIAETGETVKAATRSLKRAEQREQIRVYVPPRGKYQVITTDFSWTYRDQLDGSDLVRGAPPYPPQTVEEIVEFVRGPLAACCDEVCLYGCWVTNPIILDLDTWPTVQRAIENLGFRPVKLETWRKIEVSGKPFTGLGNGVRNDTEQLVLFARGTVIYNELGQEHGRPLQRTCFDAPIGEHSEKPALAYERLEQLVPYTSRLEMFSRAPREGWVTSGSELPTDEAPPPKKRGKLWVNPEAA